MAGRKLRSDSVLFSIGDLRFNEQDEIVYDKALQLPTHRFIIERFFTIKKNLDVSNCVGTVFDTAVSQLSNELLDLWIFCNVYPSSLTAIKKRLKAYISTIDTLTRTPEERLTTPNYLDKVEKLKIQVQNGFDIKTTNAERIKKLEKEYDVKMTKAEDDFYKDNCVPDEKTKICPRIRFSGDTDSVWYRAAVKRRERRERERARATEQQSSGQQSAPVKVDYEEELFNPASPKASDEEYIPEVESHHRPQTSVPQTRSSSSAFSESSASAFPTQEHPQFLCREGFRTMNPTLMVVLGGLVSNYGVSENKASECFQFIANNAFGQSLKLPGEDVIRMEDEKNEDEVAPEKKPRKFGNLSSTLPSARTIHNHIEDQAILSLWHVADEIKASQTRSAVVTLGWDDTVKKAGHHRHDIKAGHVTIVENDKKRSTFSTGLYENISHSGEDSGETIDMVMGSLAALTDVSKDELYSYIDFWINDRAGDNIVMLDTLGVEMEKRLFCNAHVLLTIDEAIDTAFRLTEIKAGKAKLISKDASHVFSSPQNSIFYLGLIALCKLLSDTHCTESISLYKDYKRFLNEQKEKSDGEEVCQALKDNFLGFQSNRFGRISHLSTIVLKHIGLLCKFFDENVDENANKLVLACNAFLNSQWFSLCCKISSKFGECLVIPLLEALGIDKYKHTKSEYRSWEGIRTLFEIKLDMLQQMGKSNTNNTAIDVLTRKCALYIHSNMKRQLEYSQFFDKTASLVNEMKLIQAPMTNDGCEGELATCGESIKKVGSTVSLKTLSDRHIIVRNKLFISDKWRNLTLQEKRNYLKWARNSREAKLVREKGPEYLEKVKAAQNVQLEMRASKKKKKIKRSIDLLQKIKKDGGPVTVDDLDRLDVMDTKQLLDQISYLRCTIAPNIRQKVKNKKSGKFTTLSDEELRRQVTDVIKPIDELETDLNSLVLDALANDEDFIDADGKDSSSVLPIGEVAEWKGDFDRQCIGVLVTRKKLQLFRNIATCYYKASDLTEDPNQWQLINILPSMDYCYVESNGTVLLKLQI